MKCSFKTMFFVGLAMALCAGLAYFAFKDARAAIVASLPVLALLLCPLSMLIMMKFMHDSGADKSCESKPNHDTRGSVANRAGNLTKEST